MASAIEGGFFISYRGPQAAYSTFLDVDEVLECKDFDKVFDVYQAVLKDINLYDPSKVDKLSHLEGKLYTRLHELLPNGNAKVEKALYNQPWFIKLLKIGLSSCFHINKPNLQKQIEQLHDKFKHHIALIKERLLPKKVEAAPKALQELQNIRLDSPKKELKRLKQIDQVKRSLQQVSDSAWVKLSNDKLIAIGRSIELREKIKNTHYVINHGQGPSLILVQLVMNAFKKIFDEIEYEQYLNMRHDAFLKEIKKDQDVSYYIEALQKDIDWSYPELICCDFYLKSIAYAESALFFFTWETNVHNDVKFIRKILSQICSYYIPDPSRQVSLVHTLCELFHDGFGNGGTLYSICVPKDQFADVGFLSKSYGTPTKNQYTAEHLERLQDGFTHGDISSIPHEIEWGCTAVPQVRLLAQKLDPKNDIYIVAHSTLDNEILLAAKKIVEDLIHQTLGHRNCSKLELRALS